MLPLLPEKLRGCMLTVYNAFGHRYIPWGRAAVRPKSKGGFVQGLDAALEAATCFRSAGSFRVGAGADDGSKIHMM